MGVGAALERVAGRSNRKESNGVVFDVTEMVTESNELGWIMSSGDVDIIDCLDHLGSQDIAGKNRGVRGLVVGQIGVENLALIPEVDELGLYSGKAELCLYGDFNGGKIDRFVSVKTESRLREYLRLQLGEDGVKQMLVDGLEKLQQRLVIRGLDNQAVSLNGLVDKLRVDQG